MRRDGVNLAMMFRDRTEAGERLARELIRYEGAPNTVLFALPRGGVAIAHVIAQRLHLPIDLIITRKVGHPVLPEFAIAAVSEDGAVIANEREKTMVDPAWFDYQVRSETREAERRRRVYMKGKPHRPYTGMTAIVVDDGVATGLTLQAAIASVRTHDPARIIVAVPVISTETASLIERHVDELVTIARDKSFRGAVGAYYEHFEQLSDKEVCDLLAQDHFYTDASERWQRTNEGAGLRFAV